MQRGIAALGLALTLSTGLAGCMADNGTDGGILVLKNVVAGDGCTTMASADETGLTHGVVDSLLPTGYLFIAQMRSRITALAGQEDQKLILTRGARVDVTFPDTTFFSATELQELQDQGLTKYRTLFTAPIEPNGGLTDAGFELLPAPLLARINAQSTQPFAIELIATFTVEGDMSGQTVESNAFQFPVTVGRGITIVNAGTCPLATTTPRSGSTCNALQDGVVDCCTDVKRVTTSNPNGLVCPATTDTGV